ncbi:protoheme ferro-lyase [Pseudomonas psychrotolerans]|nr:protoheme ferro-lyase [Pseudomonas psychrotolerans]
MIAVASKFIEAGGEELVLIPCVNDHPAWVQALVELCEEVAERPPQPIEQPKMPA